MNTALMLLRDNAPVIGLLFAAAWAIWKVTCWTNSVDTRLQLQAQKTDQLGNDVRDLTNNFQNLANDVRDLTNNFQNLANDVRNLTNDVRNLTNDVRGLTNDVQNLTNSFSRLEARVDALSEKVDGLQHVVHGHS